MPIQMLFEFCTLKLLLKTYSTEFLMNLKYKTFYNTRNDDLKLIKANNNRGREVLVVHWRVTVQQVPKGSGDGLSDLCAREPCFLSVGAVVISAGWGTHPRRPCRCVLYMTFELYSWAVYTLAAGYQTDPLLFTYFFCNYLRFMILSLNCTLSIIHYLFYL